MVAYSGGKCLRGPQAAGLLLGRKDLVRAAWLHSAPHHAFGRSLKVGKEEIMGMLAAVEAWVKRDYQAEMKVWESWLNSITKVVTSVPGVTTEIRQPNGLSNHSPTLAIRWDGEKLGITGREVEKLLYDTEPRIVLGNASGDRRTTMASSVSIMPYMMMPEDHKVVAERLRKVLADPPRMAAPAKSEGPLANVDGQWRLNIRYFNGAADHVLMFEQKDATIVGTHRGDITTSELRGSVAGPEVRFNSRHRYEGGSIDYDFAGKLENDRITGTVTMGEYGAAEFTAERFRYRA